MSYITGETENHIHLSKDGLIITDLKGIGSNGGGRLYSLSSGVTNSYGYYVVHSNIDAEAKFVLFDD